MDIRQATGLARAMVEEWGLSEKVGMLYAGRQQEGFMVSSTISSRSQALVDEEVQQLLDAAEARARQILSDNIEGLHRLKDALLEYETLSAEEVETVLSGSEIARQPSEATPDSTDSTPQPATGRPKIRSGLPKIGGAPTPAE